MSDYRLIDAEPLNKALTDFADAIRRKGNLEGKLSFPDGMIAAIDSFSYKMSQFIDRSITEITIEDLKAITKIGYYAFAYCKNLVNVNIPDNIVVIMGSAFSGCSALTNIELPNTLVEIGNSAFANCSALTNIELPDTLVEIGNSAFANCSALTNINIPSSVTHVGNDAFYQCRNLQYTEDGAKYLGDDTNPYTLLVLGNVSYGDSCIINPNTKFIHSDAFAHNTIASITIPNSIIEIGEDAFWGSKITEIHINDLSAWCNICFNDNPLSKATNLYSNGELVTELDIPNATHINDNAFFGCAVITSVNLHNNITKIGENAFRGCIGITALSIPDSVTSIGKYAFYGCTGITTLTLGSGLTSISDLAFYGCTGITALSIPDSVTNIGASAFDGCAGITALSIPDSVTNIGANAFDGCTGITALSIPDSVTNIGVGAFSRCTGITNLTLGNGLTNSSLDASAFSYCTGVTNLTLGNGFTRIPYDIYRNRLVHVTLGDGFTIITSSTFGIEELSKLESMTLGSKVSTIEGNAFTKCTVLTFFTINTINPPTLSVNAFFKVPDDCIIYVPAESVNAYKAATNWSARADYIFAIEE